MDIPQEVVEQLVLFLGTIALGGLALMIFAYLGHFMGGVMENWLP